MRVAGQGPAGARLWLMLLTSGLTTRVEAGENRGETLRNDHVVRDWRGPVPLGAGTTVSLALPAGSQSPEASSWAVAAVADDARGQTLQAVYLPLAGFTPRCCTRRQRPSMGSPQSGSFRDAALQRIPW